VAFKRDPYGPEDELVQTTCDCTVRTMWTDRSA